MWRSLQERFGQAEAIASEATGVVVGTDSDHAGRAIASIEASVQVARPGFGAVDLTVQAADAASAPIRVASLGTGEGIFSLDRARNQAFSCGKDWIGSCELADFLFLCANWSGFCAREGDPDVVSLLPRQAERPGLTGLHARWNASAKEAARSAILWLNTAGDLASAELRLDQENILQ